MKTDDDTMKFSLWSHFLYSIRLLKRVEGWSAILFSIGDILMSIIVPFAAMLVPSIIVKLLTSDNEKLNTLLIIAGYIVALQLARVLQGYLRENRKKKMFLLRVDGGMEYCYRCLEMDDQLLESSKGQKKIAAAQETWYYGNDKGIEAFINGFITAIINLGGMTVYTVIIGTMNLPLLAMLIVLSVLIAYANYKAGDISYKKTDPVFVKIFQGFRYLRNEILAPGNGKDIRMYRMDRWFHREFDRIKKDTADIKTKEQNYYMAANIIENVLSLVRSAVVYGFLIYQMFMGNIEISTFLLYVGAVAGFGGWMSEFFTGIQTVLQNRNTMDNYRDFMYASAITNNGSGHVENTGKPHEIRLENVSFRYEGEDEDVIKNLSLTIRKGEKIALVGVNGAGKTTLIKLICGLFTPTEGKIYLDGQDIATLDKREYFKELAVVFQDVFAFSFSLENNVTCCKHEDVDREKLADSLNRAELSERIGLLPDGVQTMMNKDIDEAGITLSGGEMQKLMLARALYKEAPIIILDEPTAALDPIAESSMYEKYYEMTKERTSVFISHRLSSTRFCDRILFMENGRIIEEGSHTELMAGKGAYAKMFEIQAQYYQENKQEVECYV